MFGLIRAGVITATVAAAGGTLGGYDALTSVTYVWLGQALIGPVYFFAWSELAQRIRTGDVAVDLAAAVQLWLVEGAEFTASFVYGGNYAAQFPTSVFGTPARVLFTFVVPAAFGAGKSTTIKMLTGILKPTSGTAVTCGLEPLPQRRQLARRIGVVFGQRSQLWWDLPLRDSFRALGAIHRLGRDALSKERLRVFLTEQCTT